MEWTDNRTENEKRLEADNKALQEAAWTVVGAAHAGSWNFESRQAIRKSVSALAELLDKSDGDM